MTRLRRDLYHNLATLLDAGTPPSRALPLAAEGLSGRAADGMRELGQAVDQGDSLADVADRSPAFPPLDRTLIRVGEESGQLSDTAALLARWYTFETKVQKELLSGLAFPVAVIHGAALIFPIPRLFESGVGAYLTGAAMVLAFWYSVAAVIYVVFRTGALRTILDPLLLRVPLIGGAILRLELSRYCRCFSCLYQGGVPVSRAAEVAARVCHNEQLRLLLDGARASAENGSPMAEGFGAGLPPQLVTTWALGEESGTLDEVSTKLADQFAEDAERVLAELGRWIPRLLYALVMLQMALMILTRWNSLFARL